MIEVETPPNRKQRRARNRTNTVQQQLATLMKRVYDEQRVKQREGEPVDDYFKRIRAKALQIQRYERAKKRKAARSTRKRNRR